MDFNGQSTIFMQKTFKSQQSLKVGKQTFMNFDHQKQIKSRNHQSRKPPNLNFNRFALQFQLNSRCSRFFWCAEKRMDFEETIDKQSLANSTVSSDLEICSFFYFSSPPCEKHKKDLHRIISRSASKHKRLCLQFSASPVNQFTCFKFLKWSKSLLTFF